MSEWQPKTDIVERLRDRNAVVMSGLFHAIPTMNEAADEIERLRAANKTLTENAASLWTDLQEALREAGAMK